MNFPLIHNWLVLPSVLAILAPVWGSVPIGLPPSPVPPVVAATPSVTAGPTQPASPPVPARPNPATSPAASPVPQPSSAASTAGTPTASAPRAAVIVRFTSHDAAVRLQVLGEAAAVAGVTDPRVVRELATGALLVHATGGTQAYLAALRAQPGVVAASPNSTVTRAATATDPYFSSQWALQPSGGGAGFTSVWDRTRGTGARVAVIDTGKTNHPDLTGQWLGGYDFVSDPTAGGDGNGRDGDASDTGDYCDPDLSSWHGTHVAGIIAARRNNGRGIAGAAPDAKVVPVRVLARCGGEMADLIDAIVWSAGGKVPGMAANPYPVRVINMSLSSRESCSRELQTALSMARRLGAVSVVAAGNDYGQPASEYAPGNCSGVVTVAASTAARTLASYSNSGAGVNLAAPGGDGTAGTAILSTLLTDSATNAGGYSYGWMAGTSMAAPHVAATAALLLSLKPTLTVRQVEQILTSTAVSSSGCAGCGAGILDAAAAIAQVPVLDAASVSGRQLTVTGSGFSRATRVGVGTHTLTFTRSGDGTITATIPSGVAVGTHAVTVFTDDISSASRLVTVR
nr:S8 family serine peptidase [Tessaracoccus sp. SD287]